MCELNALFEQILHAEQDFKARIDKLRELSSSTQQCQLELEQVQERAHSLQGELVVRRTTLADLEARSKLLAVRKAVLQGQRNQLAKNKMELSADLDQVNSVLEADRQCFLEEMLEFSQSYDLQGGGRGYRERQAKRKISLLQDELLLLEAELTEVDGQREEVEKLEEELRKAEYKLKQERANEEDLRKSVSEYDSEIQQLERDKADITQKLSRDPEFIRLQQELEACRNCTEEVQCQRLNTELEQFQRQCYQKQMKQQLTLQRRRSGIESNSGSERGNRQDYDTPSSSSSLYAPGHQTRSQQNEGGRTAALPECVSSLDQQLNGSLESDCGVSLVGEEWLMEDDDDDEEEEEEEGDGEGEGEGEGEGGTLSVIANDDENWDAELNESELMSFENDDIIELESFLHAAPARSEPLRAGSRRNITPADGNSWTSSSGEIRRDSSKSCGRSGHNSTKSSLMATSQLHQSVAQSNQSTASVFTNSRRSSITSSRATPTCDWNTSVQATRTGRGTRTTVDNGAGRRVPQWVRASRSSATAVSSSLTPGRLHQGNGSGARSQSSGDVATSAGGERRKQARAMAPPLVATSGDVPSSQGRALRKRPGESIYKHPGQQNSSVPKSAKRVRFHY